jgi:hypothetical protein
VKIFASLPFIEKFYQPLFLDVTVFPQLCECGDFFSEVAGRGGLLLFFRLETLTAMFFTFKEQISLLGWFDFSTPFVRGADSS